MKESTFLSLNWKDLGKGLIVAVLTAFITSLVQVLESGALPTPEQLKAAGIFAASAAAGYLLKNVLTNSKDQFLTKEPK